MHVLMSAGARGQGCSTGADNHLTQTAKTVAHMVGSGRGGSKVIREKGSQPSVSSCLQHPF